MKSQPVPTTAVLPAALSPFIISFDCTHCRINKLDNQDDGKVFVISVDGTHCRINEPYSKKHNTAGLAASYEVVWIDDGPDISIG